MNISAEFYEPDPRLDVGTWTHVQYEHNARGVADALAGHGMGICVYLDPGNGTAYRLAVARIIDQVPSRKVPVSVVWVDIGMGHVFDLAPHGEMTAEYVQEKFQKHGARCGISDAWIISRFLTALRAERQRMIADATERFFDEAAS